MAEPLTALGTIAANSQPAGRIFSTSFAICDFCLKIHDAPSSIREQFTHLQNPELQTCSVASVMGTYAREVEEVRRLLDKSV